MRKTILTTSLLVILTLSLTQLATAQWKNNVFKNETSGDVFVAFTTYRPATGNVPLGWRTVAWYRVKAGQSHTFNAFDDNPIYYLIIDQATGRRLLPENAQLYTGWMYNKAFVIVSEDEPKTLTPAADLLYTTHARTSNLLLDDGNFFKSENTGSVTVTPTGVIAPLAELQPTEDLVIGGGDEETPEDPPTVSEDESIRITSSEGTTLTQGKNTVLTVETAANSVISLSVPSNIATLSSNFGTTNSDGDFKTTLTIRKDAPPGNFNVTASIANTDNSQTLPITVELGAGSVDISRSVSTIEPGQTSSITVTLRTTGGTLFSGQQISLSASVGNISPTLVTTNSSGKATATYRADQYTSTPHPRTISTPSITATVVDDPTVKRNTTITVRYVPSSLSIGGYSTSITSGRSTTVTATVTSKTGKRMSGVSVRFSENSRYIRFSRSSGTTNSSGQTSSTLRTGGKTSGASFTVSTSGVSSKSATVRVNPTISTKTEYFSDEGKRIGAFTTNYYQNRSKAVDFPGRVVSASWRTESYSATVTRQRIRTPGSDDVTIDYKILAKTTPLAWIRVWVTAKYEVVASAPGAPSLQTDLRPETRPLSEVWQELSEVPSETLLLANYPNPFNPETWIPYHLAEPAEVTLTIYAADGKLVRTLALGHQPAGIYENKSRAAYWDGRNTIGERVASGLYFYTLTAGNVGATRKMLIMK